MFLKRTRKNKNIDKKEQLIKLVASFIFLIGSFMYIGRIAYNYYIELRDYNKAQEFLNIGKEEVEEIKVNIDEEPQIAEAEKIEVIPTLVLYRNGKAIDSIVAPESKIMIENFINEALEK